MSLGIFAILLLIIFTTELAVMEILAPLFSDLSILTAATLDAGILVLLFSLPLWFLFSQPFARENVESPQGSFKRKRVAIFSKLLSVVFIVEFLVMLFLPGALPQMESQHLALLDSTLTTLIVLPVLWWMLSRLDQRYREVPMADFLNTPVMLYILFLYMIFLAELTQEVVLPHQPGAYSKLIDSIVTTIFIAPFFWLLVGRPLTRAIQSERARALAIRDQVVDAVVSLDADGRIDSMNPAAQSMFGYDSEELSGQPAEKIFAKGQTNVEDMIAIFSNKNPKNHKMIFGEVICKCRNKSTLIMDISISSILYLGHREWVLILRDISDRKESERALLDSDARFRQIFEQSDDAIIFFKPETCTIIDVNDTCAELFGYSKSEIIPQDLATLFGSNDLLRVSSAIKEIGRGTPARLDNFIGKHKNGSQFNLSLRGKLMTLNGINVVFCSFRDITNRIKLEKEAKNIQARLIQTNKMTSLGLLVSGVAHEINNPNNFIMSNSRLLASTWDDNSKILRDYHREHGDFCLGGMPFSELEEHTPQLFAGIMDGSRRINEIVNNLKKFYRQEQSSDGTIVDINVVATSAVSLLHHELVNFTENFQMDLADDLPGINGNAQQLGQVVINLLMNACQSLPNKDHGIRLSTACNTDHSLATLSVRDEGHGMSAEDSRRIMDPFFTTKLDSGGTGLGLSICRSIILEHRGNLFFKSEPGKGSTFVVELPINMPVKKD